jgi:hypothetical protein
MSAHRPRNVLRLPATVSLASTMPPSTAPFGHARLTCSAACRVFPKSAVRFCAGNTVLQSTAGGSHYVIEFFGSDEETDPQRGYRIGRLFPIHGAERFHGTSRSADTSIIRCASGGITSGTRRRVSIKIGILARPEFCVCPLHGQARGALGVRRSHGRGQRRAKGAGNRIFEKRLPSLWKYARMDNPISSPRDIHRIPGNGRSGQEKRWVEMGVRSIRTHRTVDGGGYGQAFLGRHRGPRPITPDRSRVRKSARRRNRDGTAGACPC